MEMTERAVKQLRSQLAMLLLLQYSLVAMAIWGFIWGVAVLVLRITVHLAPLTLLWGACGLLAAVVIAVFVALPHIPDSAVLRAILDNQNRCGGLLMAADEVPVAAWQDKLGSIEVPKVKFYATRTLVLFMASAVFVTVSFVVPDRFAIVPQRHTLEIGQEVGKLQSKIEVLEEEKIVESSKAETMKKRLKQLAEQASGEDPAKTWEALDHMENMADKAAKEAVEKALQTTEKLTKMETLAKGLAEVAPTMDQKQLAEMMAQLSEMVQKSLEENPQLQNYMPEKVAKSCQNNSLSKEQMKSLMAAMQGNKEDIKKMLESLQKNGMANPKNLEQNSKSGQCNSSGLKEFLEQNASQMSTSEMMAIWCEKFEPGKGGIDEGGGKTPMVFGDKSSEENVKFKEQILPPADLEAMKNSQRIGISIGSPVVEKDPGTFTSGVLENTSSDGGSAFSHQVLPRHREAVRNYFIRESGNKK